MKLVKIELALWFTLVVSGLTYSFTIETPETDSEDNTAVAVSDSRSYMESNSELNGILRTELDEIDGGK